MTVTQRAGETCERQRMKHCNTIKAIRAALDEMLDVRQMVIVPLRPRCLKIPSLNPVLKSGHSSGRGREVRGTWWAAEGRGGDTSSRAGSDRALGLGFRRAVLQ